MVGFFYLVNTSTILLAAYFLGGLVVAGDPAATAHNFLAREPAFRLGFALEMVSTASSIGVAASLYELFKPVSPVLSLLAAAFRFIACAVAAIGYLFQLSPLQVLAAAPHLGAFRLQEIQDLAFLLHGFSSPASRIVIVFFGFHFLCLSILIFRSGFLPKLLGAFVGLAGLGGLTFLMPQIAVQYFPEFAAVGALGEVSLTLWLLIFGVDAQKWRALDYGGLAAMLREMRTNVQ